MPPFLKIRRDWSPRKTRKIKFGKFGASKFSEIFPFGEIGVPPAFYYHLASFFELKYVIYETHEK